MKEPVTSTPTPAWGEFGASLRSEPARASKGGRRAAVRRVAEFAGRASQQRNGAGLGDVGTDAPNEAFDWRAVTVAARRQRSPCK